MRTKYWVACFLLSAFTLNADWDPAIVVASPPCGIDSGFSPIAIDPHSRSLVGFLDAITVGTGNNLLSTTLQPGAAAWSPAEILYVDAYPNYPSHPFMFTDARAHQYAYWTEINTDINRASVVSARRASNTIGWPEQSRLQLSALISASKAQVDDEGNMVSFVAATANLHPPYNLTLMSLSTSSSSWSAPIVVAQDDSPSPAIAVGMQKSQAVLVWKAKTSSLSLQSAWYDVTKNQLGKTSNIPLPKGSVDIETVDVRVDSRGNAIAIFNIIKEGKGKVYVTTLRSGSNNWEKPRLLSNPDNDGRFPTLAIDARANAMLLWTEKPSSTQQFVRVARLSLEGKLSDRSNLTDHLAANTAVGSAPSVVMDAYGNAVAIWGIAIDGVATIQVSSETFDHRWFTETLSTAGVSPQVALSDQGTAVAIWQSTEGGFPILSSTNVFLFPLIEPRKFFARMVSNNGRYSIDFKWVASPVPNITHYELYRNGKRFATIPADDRISYSFNKKIKSKKVAVAVYSIVAFASNGNNSYPIDFEM